MTSLLEPTRTLPAAHRSSPDALRTAVFAPAAEPETELDLAPRTVASPRRGRAWLAGAVVALAGVATVVGVSTHAPLEPLPAAPAPIGSSSTCVGGACDGLDPTTDQQLAGLVMWIPGGLVHGVAAILMFYKWLKLSEDGHAVALH